MRKFLAILAILVFLAVGSIYAANYTKFWETCIQAKHGLTYVLKVLDSSDNNLFTVNPSGVITVAGDLYGDGGDQFYGFGREVLHKATHYTVTAADTGKVFLVDSPSNAVGIQQFTLPSATKGLVYTFVVSVEGSSGWIIVKPASADEILVETDSTGDGIATRGVAHAITLTAISSSHWMVTSIVGTWKDNN